MQIDQINTVTDELVDAFQRLGPQLSEKMAIPSRQQLEEIVASPATTLLVARDTDQGRVIVATLTLVVYRTPAGVSSHIEDVVVDQAQRGKGIGEALTRAAMAICH